MCGACGSPTGFEEEEAPATQKCMMEEEDVQEYAGPLGGNFVSKFVGNASVSEQEGVMTVREGQELRMC